MQWPYAVLNLLYWLIAYPLIVILSWLLLLLYWIASPVIYLGHFLIQAGLLPIRFLAKFEVRRARKELLLNSFANVHIPDTLYLLWRRHDSRHSNWPHPTLSIKN